MAVKLLIYYNEKMSPHLHCVIFARDTTMKELRKSKLTLLLAVLAMPAERVILRYTRRYRRRRRCRSRRGYSSTQRSHCSWYRRSP